ncbi:MAG: hypothetical protein M1496_02430 [Candidatus Thermoplasmatota archaeon]|nr:hypothetical protein [Candidatus Thermoplasmatota archaeon]
MKNYEMTILSPLYYRSRIESGAAGATVTSPWIGDIAMMYAINNSLGLKQLKFGYNTHKPNYSEIMDIGFKLSILEPSSQLKFTKVFDIATSFISEGYPQGKAIADSARAPMRNWLKRQGLEPGNKFIFSSFLDDEENEFPKKFTVRIGNTKECLGEIREIENNHFKEVTMNLYTLSLMLGTEKLKKSLANLMKSNSRIQIEQVSPQYVLARGFKLDEARGLIEYN